MRLIRFLVALLALAVCLAGPGAALAGTPLRAAPMPCHESAGVPVASSVATTHLAASQRPRPADGAARHLCCVLGQMVLPLLAMPPLEPPYPQASRLALPAGAAPIGHVPAIPVPPPRFA
ncbi:hypothetical protein [Ancylobacter radicis]|uniref:DUF2946 domain-containing protein n=1 Tax=Ancylobacter radicis TaxID=2836179 RepID=A0ABS5R9U5_9HYPH|nr:hypothetical protein [Ancylobacter radicis]MBS9478438.1 hypothetical protein [Ancylobacter radicis]